MLVSSWSSHINIDFESNIIIFATKIKKKVYLTKTGSSMR